MFRFKTLIRIGMLSLGVSLFGTGCGLFKSDDYVPLASPAAAPAGETPEVTPMPTQPAPGPVPLPGQLDPTDQIVEYTVKDGDTLWEIARDHKTTVSKIKAASQLETDLIIPGQKLQVPTKQPGAATPATPPAAAPPAVPATPPAAQPSSPASAPFQPAAPNTYTPPPAPQSGTQYAPPSGGFQIQN